MSDKPILGDGFGDGLVTGLVFGFVLAVIVGFASFYCGELSQQRHAAKIGQGRWETGADGRAVFLYKCETLRVEKVERCKS